MRIGIDSHAAEQDGSGNCTYFQNLILQLSKLDTKNEYVLFVTNENHTFYRNIANHPNFQIVPIVSRPAWFRVFVALSVATYRMKVDVFHVQYFAPFFHRGVLINTVHDLAFWHYPQHFRFSERVLFKTLLPWSARKAWRILTASEVSRRDLLTLMRIPERSVTVSYYGVNETFSNESSEKDIDTICRQYKLTGKFLLYVGRIDSRKNIDTLVQAYSDFRSRYALDHKLVLVGKVYLEPPSLRETLRQCPYSNDISFSGYVADQHLPAIYKAADAFIYISSYEGFGLPPLEAMAAGTPVIASDIPVFREILSDAALFVNAGDARAVADGIYRIVSDGNVKSELTKKGKDRVKQFTWDKTAAITLQTYESAIQHIR